MFFFAVPYVLRQSHMGLSVFTDPQTERSVFVSEVSLEERGLKKTTHMAVNLDGLPLI